MSHFLFECLKSVRNREPTGLYRSLIRTRRSLVGTPNTQSRPTWVLEKRPTVRPRTRTSSTDTSGSRRRSYESCGSPTTRRSCMWGNDAGSTSSTSRSVHRLADGNPLWRLSVGLGLGRLGGEGPVLSTCDGSRLLRDDRTEGSLKDDTVDRS